MKSKKYQKALSGFESTKKYSLDESLEILKKFPQAKFDESIEVHINLNVDTKKTDQQIRTTIVLPYGVGKAKRIAVFTETQQEEAKKLGVEVVGGDKLIQDILKNKQIDFDVVLATPEIMPKLSKIAKILGPRGLMPSPKTQTIGVKVVEMIEEFKKGKSNLRSDKYGNIHQVVGKRSFSNEQLKENIETLLEVVNKNKPENSKGKLIKTVTLTATMTPGIKILI